MVSNKWHYTYDIHNYVTIKGHKYRLNTAYDNIMLLIKAMNDEYLENKVEAYFELMFFSSDHKRLNEDIKDFTNEDISYLIEDINKNVIFFENVPKGKRQYDLDLDADLIFASFYKDYGISLVEKKGKMKWVEFIILLDNLSEDTPLMRVIKIANTKSKDLTPEGKKMKRERNLMLNGKQDLDTKLEAFEKLLSNGVKSKNESK